MAKISKISKNVKKTSKIAKNLKKRQKTAKIVKIGQKWQKWRFFGFLMVLGVQKSGEKIKLSLLKPEAGPRNVYRFTVYLVATPPSPQTPKIIKNHEKSSFFVFFDVLAGLWVGGSLN